MKEVWKKIKNVNGDYSISSFGRIKSFMGYAGRVEILIKPTLDKRGYERVCIGKRKARISRRVHRLVAQAFIHNPKNKRTVNHKNGIKTDNRVSNLEWSTDQENIRHAFNVLGKKIGKGKDHPVSKPVNQISISGGKIIKRHESIHMAATYLGISQSAISQCLGGRSNTSGGFIWKYA